MEPRNGYCGHDLRFAVAVDIKEQRPFYIFKCAETDNLLRIRAPGHCSPEYALLKGVYDFWLRAVVVDGP